MKSTVHKAIRHNTVQNIKIYYNTIKYNHRLDEMQRAWIRAVCAIMSNIIPWLLYVGLRTYLLFGYCCVATQWLLYCTVLYCTVLCCIVLYCIALHCVVMYNNVPNCMVDWNVHLHIELYRTVLSNILQYNIIQCSTTSYNTINYSAAQYITILTLNPSARSLYFTV